MNLVTLTPADTISVARWAYTYGRESSSGANDFMPPWEELPYEQQNNMAADVLNVYNALVAHGFVLMKDEGMQQ